MKNCILSKEKAILGRGKVCISRAAILSLRTHAARLLKHLFILTDEHVRQQQSSGSRAYEHESQRRSQHESQSRARQRQADHRKHSSSFDYMSPEEILGITSGASLEEVKAAFRRQMLLYHPDQQVGGRVVQFSLRFLKVRTAEFLALE